MTKEEVLRNLTYKDEGFELGRRIFYTLHGDQSPESKTSKEHQIPNEVGRNTRLLSNLVARLRDKGIFTDAEIDDLLFETVY